MGIRYRPPNQDEEADEAPYKRLAEVSKSPPLVPMEDFNLLGICWKYSTAEKKQSKRLLECMEENFLVQLVNELSRGGASLDLLFTNSEGLMGEVMVRGHLRLSDHETTEFSVLAEVRRRFSKTTTMGFPRADFGLFKALVKSVPLEDTPEGQRGPGRLNLVQEVEQGQAVPMCH